MERNYKYDVLTEHDLGVNIDLINRELYQTDPYAQLDPADERLLEEDIHTTHQDSVRSRQHAKSVSWLRKSEYISTEKTRFQPQNLETVEAKVGYNVKKSLREETLYMDRETQIQNIEKTFDDSKTPITRHFSKPNVVAEEVLPLYPDFKNWKYPCAQVIFDADPAPMGKKMPAQLEEMSQAMIRGVMDESGEQFVAYFLPTEPTLEKRRRDHTNEVLYEDEEEYEYKMFREYNWTVKSKASKGYEENYYLVMRPDGVYYNELETRVRLSKRRQKAGQTANNTKLVVKHRVLNANEHRMQRFREKQLEAPAEDDEEEMAAEEEDDEPDQKITKTKAPEVGAADTDNNAGDEEADESGKGGDKAATSQEEADKTARKSRSRSRSGSRSGSPTNSERSRSRSKSGSRSRSRSRSGSRRRSKSGSRSRSGSRTPSRSRSRSGSRVASPHSARSGSGSPRSRSGSPRSGSGSPRSKTGSPRSKSGSPRSKSGSRSRSGSPHSSGSGSRSRSGSRSGDSD